jgi:hypothetical protein
MIIQVREARLKVILPSGIRLAVFVILGLVKRGVI